MVRKLRRCRYYLRSKKLSEDFFPMIVVFLVDFGFRTMKCCRMWNMQCQKLQLRSKQLILSQA